MSADYPSSNPTSCPTSSPTLVTQGNPSITLYPNHTSPPTTTTVSLIDIMVLVPIAGILGIGFVMVGVLIWYSKPRRRPILTVYIATHTESSMTPDPNSQPTSECEPPPETT